MNRTNKDDDIHVFVVDSYQDFVGTGTMYPENKKQEMFLLNNFTSVDGIEYETFDDAKEFLFCFMTDCPSNAPAEWYDDKDMNLRLFIQQEYVKLSDDVKTNGVLLREALLDIKKRANY